MKLPVRWTIDKEIIIFLKKKSREENRSVSYVANEILKEKIKNEN